MVARDRAWRSLVALLDVRAGISQDDARACELASAAVVEFVGSHPGVLEAYVGDHERDLVRDWGGQRAGALYNELRDSEKVRPYARGLLALSSDGLLRAFAALWRRNPLVGERCTGRSVEALVRRVAPTTLDALELPPEAYDALHALAGRSPLPDIVRWLRNH